MTTYAQKLADLHAAMVQDDRFGYSQWPYRWGEDGETTTIDGVVMRTGSYDCSSSILAACKALSIPVGAAYYTGNMEASMVGTGAFAAMPYRYGALKRGDVILNPSRHVTLYQGAGMMSTFDINEKGGAYSGQTGDQSGYEARIREVYDFGQTRILRCVWSLPHEDVKLDERDGAVHRLYNPNSGEHMFTQSHDEADGLIDAGWGYEGAGWVAPSQGVDVWRLYNPNAGDHMFTASADERDFLVSAGWRDEGAAFYGGGDVPVWRVYNPNAIAGAHHFTTSGRERDALVGLGWRDEGAAFHASKA